MKYFKRFLTLVLIIAIVAMVVPTMAFADNNKPADEFVSSIVPGEVNVLLKEQYYEFGGPYPDLREILPEIEIESYSDLMLDPMLAGAERPHKDNLLARVGTEFWVKLTEKTVEATMKAVELLKSNPYVKWAGPNCYLEMADTIPNDPLFAPESGTGQWGLDRIGAPEAWDYLTGSDATDGSEMDDYVKVAVLDTGVYDQHPDLVNNLDMSLAYNAYHNVMGNTTDYIGHGTHVAGIIGAEGNNDIGISGVCWNVEMVPIKITADLSINYSNDERKTSPCAITRALNYASDNDIMIANLSFSLTYYYSNSYEENMVQAMQDYSFSGGLLVIAAGNSCYDLDNSEVYLDISNISGIILVGALADNASGDNKAYFSSYGETVVDLFAPGESIMSTVLYTDDPSGYQSWNGTSMATPFVTGAAALIKSANTTYSGSAIKKKILNNVVTSPNLSNYCSTGGRLSIPDALYDMGNQVIISNTMTHGTVRPSAIFTMPNTIVYLTAYPDAGYMLKPGSMKHNSSNTMQISKRRCFCSMPYSNDTITAQFYMVGDIDFDGAVTVTDSLTALRHANGLTVLTGDALLAADVDGDGDVDITDAQTIQAFAARLIDRFPIED